jgi:uncharacterized protein YndB with AHSA1/START domain
MADIRHKLVIKTLPEKIYEAVTTQKGIESWWCKQTVAKPEIGFVNTFTFGNAPIEMEVTELSPNKSVAWRCLNANEEWMNTNISFDLEEKDGRTVLRFAHFGWRAATDFFDACNYDWGRFMASLKSFCENGTGTPS